MNLIHSCCAALDVHKTSVTACVRRYSSDDPDAHEVRTFATTTTQLQRLRDWLLDCGVSVVAMESTGVYWKPVFNVLEGHLPLMLVNAEHYKQVEGRKTDVADCTWLSQLLQHGLLRPSFVPAALVRQLRDLTRQRVKLVQQRSGVVNRIQKVLEDANIKLGDVASDVLGKSGRRMLEALIRGERDPNKLAELALGRLRAKLPQLREALRGLVSAHHAFLLQLHLDQLDGLDRLIERISARVLEVAAATEPPQPPRPEAGQQASAEPSAGAVEPSQAEPPAGVVEPGQDGTADAVNGLTLQDEAATTEPGVLAVAQGLRLVGTIPGIKERTAEVIVAEIGTDMGAFATAQHLVSWAGLCPGNHQSAGKRYHGRMRRGDRWLKRALSQAAWAVSRTRGCWLQQRYRRWARRLGKKRAIMAVAHKLLELCYWVLKHRSPYQDPLSKQAA